MSDVVHAVSHRPALPRLHGMSIQVRSARRWLRAGIVLLIVSESVIGVWQHMFDVAGLGLGLIGALLFAAVSLDYQIVRASLVASATYTAIHFVYQELHFDGSAARVISGSLIIEFLLAVGLLGLTPRLKRRHIYFPVRSAGSPARFRDVRHSVTKTRIL
jgi:hypothetical protein